MHLLFKGLVTVTGVLGYLAASSNAQSTVVQDLNVDPDPSIVQDDITQGIGLRILPLGASIIAGTSSSDGNGFRRYLQQELAGSKMQFVGSLRSGSMSDNYHEGHPGWVISGAEDAAAASINFRPNIILIHVGTNDLLQASSDPKAASVRLGHLLDYLLVNFPDATILLAQLIAARDPGHNTRIAALNSHMVSLVSSRADKHIMLVDMAIIKENQLTADGIHPNDAAYKIMGSQWRDGIQKAVAQGWVKDPVGPDPRPDPNNHNQNCYNRRAVGLLEPENAKLGHQCAGGVGWMGAGKIARGDGLNGDHRFNPKWIPRGGAGDPLSRDGRQMVFADLRGTGRTDRVFVAAEDGTLFAWLNDGDGANFIWEPANDGKQIFDGKCTLDRLRFADLTGSGKADVVCIMGTNNVEAYINQYTFSGGFRWDGPHQISNDVAGANRDSIYFMDVDGNGRDDMIIKQPSGELHAMLNFGQPKDISSIDWHKVGQIAPNIGTSNLTFADLNNDGRDDIVVFNSDGSMYGFLNVRGLEAGRPMWVRQDEIKGTEHWAPSDLRISDVNGDGKADYILMDPQNGGFDLFVNDGTADVEVVGDGTWLADMDGDGLDDRIWITEDGRISVWLNGQANAQAPFGWDWFAQNNQQPIVTGINAKRGQYRLADIDGDGKADLLVFDLKTGAISAWLNNGPSSDTSPQGWVWAPVGQIGVSVADPVNAQFADVTGDGKADLLWLDEESMLTIYRNNYDSTAHHWSWPKLTAEPINLHIQNPKDIRFADIDGDQKADAIAIHSWDGAAVVWLNRDPSKPEGWERSVPSPDTSNPSHPSFAGDNVRFARLSVPYGRADYVMVDPHNGALSLWKSGCSNYAPGSSSMTDKAKGDVVLRDSKEHKALSVSCGDLVVPTGGAGSEESAVTTPRLPSGKALLKNRATITLVPILENTLGQLIVPVTPPPPPIVKPSPPGPQASANGKPAAAVVAGGRTLTPGASPPRIRAKNIKPLCYYLFRFPRCRTCTWIFIFEQFYHESNHAVIEAEFGDLKDHVGSEPSKLYQQHQHAKEHKQSPHGFTIGSQTIRPGSSSITISGQTFSLDSSANLHVGTTTVHVGSQSHSISTTSVSSITTVGALAVNDTATNDTDVYVPPTLWDNASPEIALAAGAFAAAAAVGLILPPRRLPTLTTIKFPPYKTSLEIAWSEVKETESGGKKFLTTKFASMIQTTTLSIPSIVTDREEYWNVRLPKGLKATKIFPTPSYLPPPFVILEDRNPLKQKGVLHPPVRRTIMPPAFPHSVPTKFPDFPPAINIVSRAADQVGGLLPGGRGGGPLGKKLPQPYPSEEPPSTESTIPAQSTIPE
ncbi:MAG: hypothetical protein LQ348_006177 [Seirophora lacunosa]|nr:MAG: hypothetical protein LQ348_006177 [Seirophora lacunosa]